MSLNFELDFSPFKHRKNLLAFSAGIDSTALFFLLLDENIPFDIAIVDYNLRKSSKDEVSYAKELAQKYGKEIYTLETTLEDSHQEEQARHIRFDFFEEIIHKEAYDYLLTAHQLNDQLEWFLMQLSKGAGSLELLGMKNFTQRQGYILAKPLLKLSKEQLLSYLDHHQKKYFVDSSNHDESYKRNYFRHHFSDKLISKYQEGITRSFDYLDQDNRLLLDQSHSYFIEELTLISAHTPRTRLFYIDKDLKKRGYILSFAQREEIQSHQSVVISSRFVIEQVGNIVYIAPFIQKSMDKKFKELCRLAEIPSKVRPFLYQQQIDVNLVQQKIVEWQS